MRRPSLCAWNTNCRSSSLIWRPPTALKRSPRANKSALWSIASKNMTMDILRELESKRFPVTDGLKKELATIRTGHATPELVEHVRVDYSGVLTPLRQMAGISTPAPNMLVIQPWDPGTLGIIEKAILKSDIGLTLSNDGKIIRLTIPPL